MSRENTLSTKKKSMIQEKKERNNASILEKEWNKISTKKKSKF